MNQRNVILTIMQGYDYPFVEPFFESLRKVGYEGDLAIFTADDLSWATRKKLGVMGAKLFHFKTKYPFIEGYEEAFKEITPHVSINNYRFIFYLQFLKEHQQEYDRVMLTDIRDVIFQRAPFSIMKDEGIYFFLEDVTQTFRHKFNYQWLASATDKETAESLADEQVSCAGVTMGNTAMVIDYLEYIREKLSGCEKLEWGLDQGIHNSYIYLTKPANSCISGSDKPYVINLGAYQPYQLGADDEVVNTAGEAYAIVHQYDRSGKLFGLVKKKYMGSRLTQRLKRLYYLLMP